ncbi:MAG: sporulation protein [Leptospiraceae bacterium]|nr:sporulation protein [Leptospiraceae bacterium]MCP5499264.1 sporulation protein [Leptospiraceae bacterium]
MSLMDSFKSMVGKGLPKVEVKLKKTEAAVLESVKGMATITGGEYPVEIEKIVLYMQTLEENVETSKTHESSSKVGTITFNDYALEVGETIELPFQIKIPKSNLLTSTAIKNFVKVHLSISGQDTFGVCEIKII